MSGSAKRPGKQGQVRIIGGSWRGRKLAFTPLEGLRPTGDRIRETLFNWLAADIPGARCLDLFAGTGALGLEALSRGAAHCDFVDSARAVTGQVSKHLHTLGATDRANCYTGTAQSFLERCDTAYDLVFIDPPFRLDLGTTLCATLADRGLVGPGAAIYLEADARLPTPVAPPGWELHRDKQAGGVRFHLYRTA